MLTSLNKTRGGAIAPPFITVFLFYMYKMLDNIRIKRYNINRKRERENLEEILEIGTARKPAKKGRLK